MCFSLSLVLHLKEITIFWFVFMVILILSNFSALDILLL